MENIMAVVQLVVALAPAVSKIITIASTNEDIVSRVKDLSKPLADLMQSVGGKLFPKADPAIHIAGAVIAAFDPDLTKWLQGALNSLIGAGLKVDGIYGPATTAAVQKFQTTYGLKADGLAGTVTQALISGLLAKLPNLTPKAA